MPLSSNALNFNIRAPGSLAEDQIQGRQIRQQAMQNNALNQQYQQRQEQRGIRQQGVENALNTREQDRLEGVQQAKLTKEQENEVVRAAVAIKQAPEHMREPLYNQWVQDNPKWGAGAQAYNEGGSAIVDQLAYGKGGYQDPDPSAGLTGDAKNFAIMNKRMPTQEELINLKKSSAINVTQSMGGQKLTPGQKKIDENYAAEFVSWEASGGFADNQKLIGQLKDVSAELGSGKNLSGPGIGSVPDSVLKFTNPEVIANRERVEEVVQRNLRAVLGAQFTEKEGERLIKRAFNPNLPESENKKRVDSLIKQMEMAAEAKDSAAQYMKTNGTLKGWDGRQPTMNDFFNAVSGKNKDYGVKSTGSLPQGVTEDDITETMRANNMTRQQVMQRLGGQ